MVVKHRTFDAYTSGTLQNAFGTQTFNKRNVIQEQRTNTIDTAFPQVRHALRSGLHRGTGLEWVFTHRDFGSAFVTESSAINSSLGGQLTVRTSKGNSLPQYIVESSGPILLGWNSVIGLQTAAEQTTSQQQLWTYGSRAVKAARPNKPALDLPVLLGELRKDGIPTIIGSLMSRSKTARDVFRQGGKEYLNVQFGWAPLVGDLVKLLALIPDSRRRIEQYERDIEKLVRRRYHFPDVTSVSTDLSFAANSASYMIQSSTPFGLLPQDHFSFSRDGAFAPSQVTKTTENIWFSGGFRFYHRSVPKALQELSLLEEKANVLLGTRLDPEILWNLAPWTWLSDWFVNFGDVLSNVSALISDDLVMQYGYLMRTTSKEIEIGWPNGLWYRKPTGNFTSGWVKFRGVAENFENRNLPSLGAYSQTMKYVRKERVKASPFGFGLNPVDFSPTQIAILAALGLSRS